MQNNKNKFKEFKMRKKLQLILVMISLISISYFVFYSGVKSEKTEIEQLREKHANFLNNSPFKKISKLSKKERKELGTPPNKYFDRQWELTMDPATGKPEPERLFALQKSLRSKGLANKNPGSAMDNSWEERGPNNVGGRTRAIMFDPNDVTNKRVFAGGVSGGLWVNNDITDENSAWSLVDIPQNLAISVITYDPNDKYIFYVGTGESYVGGDVNGDGVWQSIDGGVTWSNIFGGISGETTFESNIMLTVNSPVIIAGEYQATSAAFGPSITSIAGNLVLADDSSAAPTEACNALTNNSEISGNIAVIDRGNCTFVSKVKNAQDAGATAVLVINNVVGPPISLGGDDATITIPSVMISKEDGDLIKQQLLAGVNVTIEQSGSPFSGSFVTPGIQHINDVKVRDIGGGNSEVYVAVGESFYSNSTPSSLLGVEDYGLFKSTNEGASWAGVTLPLTPGGSNYTPNDIEISSDNTIWLSTNKNVIYGQGGGTILSSTDGLTFSVKHTITEGDRTQIAVSKLTPNVIFVLAELGSAGAAPVYMASTNDSFTTVNEITPPADVDTGIPDNDFTRGQAFYDLMIEVDPTNDAILYVGGIDLFRSADGGTNWSQISKWSNNNNLGGLSVPTVHADQHALVFNPGDANQAVFGNDGGIYFGSSLSSASTSITAISARNKNYNTLQFYKGAIGSDTSSEKLLAGAQDNGSNLINNASSGINSSIEVTGGDGAYTFIDKDNEYMISSYVYNNYYYLNYNTGAYVYEIAGNDTDGDFINPAALDSHNNLLYTSGDSKIYKYKLGTSSATSTTLTNDLLTTAPTAFKPSTFTTTTLFVGTEDGKLFKILDANSFRQTWADITGDMFYGSISCIELGATEDDIMVTFHNYGVTNVYFSQDGGTTWQNKEGNLPDLPVKAILMNPLNNNQVILGTDLGVWATSNFNDASPTWAQSQNGMKDVQVTSFDLRTSDNTILASTYGRGMFTGVFSAEDENTDTDGDGVDNADDLCPNTPVGEVVNADGCSNGQLDDDGDGVQNSLDLCSATPTGEAVDADGCGASQLDDDSDGVMNNLDLCPNTPTGEVVNADGCGDSQLDDDGDGVQNSLDLCSATPTGEAVDADGCGASQLDDDSDGVMNNLDLCPNTPTGETVDADGCSNGQLDDDGDGVENSLDLCSATPTGETVDADGCSNGQLDDDGDGVQNSLDLCSATPTGEAVGADGCGESQLDDDEDGIMNDKDICPTSTAGVMVNATGCFTLLPNNFSIEVTSETCPNKDNGQISISATAAYTYTTTINGVNYSFNNTNGVLAVDLPPAIYNVCISITGETFVQCFDVEVIAGEEIVADATIEFNKASINIKTGTAPFTIYVNGEERFTTSSPLFNVGIKHGDLIEVKTAKSCEGVYSKTVELLDVITMYPNPTRGAFEIALPISEKEVTIELYNSSLQLISKEIYSVVYGKVQLDLTNNSAGMYIVKVKLDNPVTLKIIKE